MSEYKTHNLASIIKPPTGEVVISPDAITRSLRAKDVGFIAMGFADRFQREVPLDEHGIAYVEMNKSGKLLLEPGKDGVIATSSLAGCTGVAGFAKRKDGSIAAFVSHYDPMSQNSKLTGEDTPVNKDLYGFRYQAGKDELASPLYYVVAYEAGEHSNPRYGQRNGSFKDWGYLDQINVTATQLGEDAQVLLLPYVPGQGNSLASGKTSGQEGIFWNGVRIDFDAYLATDTTSATVATV